MDEARKKQLTQIGILAVLVVGLIVAVVMFSNKNKAAAPAAPVPGAPAATDMAKAGVVPAGGASSVPATQAANGSKLNPNMWKVYSLTPPRNPFVQQESWYAATFKKLLPGYPELQPYFDKPGDVLPDVNRLFGSKVDFDEIDLKRTFRDQNYKIEGMSKDGLIDTVVSAHVKKPDDIALVFDKNGNQVKQAGPGGVPVKGENLPPLPGGKMGLPPANGEGPGESVTCSGVSFHNGHASALLHFNGNAYIVHEGGRIPPRFTNAHIKDNGVEFKDTKTGKTRFVELKAPSKEDDMPAFIGGRRTVSQS